MKYNIIPTVSATLVFVHLFKWTMNISASTPARSNLGPLLNTSRGVSGKVFITDPWTLKIQDFTYKGNKCGAFFVGIFRQPSVYIEVALEYTTSELNNRTCNQLPGMGATDIVIPLPDDVHILNFSRLSVNHTISCKSLGFVDIPNNLNGHTGNELFPAKEQRWRIDAAPKCKKHLPLVCPKGRCWFRQGFRSIQILNVTVPYKKGRGAVHIERNVNGHFNFPLRGYPVIPRWYRQRAMKRMKQWRNHTYHLSLSTPQPPHP